MVTLLVKLYLLFLSASSNSGTCTKTTWLLGLCMVSRYPETIFMWNYYL